MYEVEFFFRSSNSDHLQVRDRIKLVVEVMREKTVMVDFQEINCDELSEVPETIPALPCLRRVQPEPRRQIVGNLESIEKIEIALGLPPDSITAHLRMRSGA